MVTHSNGYKTTVYWKKKTHKVETVKTWLWPICTLFVPDLYQE